MLAKSRKSAFVMAGICVLTTIITIVIIFVIRYPVIGEREAGQIIGGIDDIIGIGAGLLGLLILISLVTILFIYPLDDSHFGCWGAVRWGIMGVGHVLLMHFLVVWLSYWLVFKLLSSAITRMRKSLLKE